jgi:hypothetical protein
MMNRTTISRSTIGELFEIVLEGGAKRATKYVSKSLTVKATLQGKRDNRSRQSTVLLTIGSPNYAERKFIKQCIAAGEPFPVKKTQIKWPPVRRKK